MPTFQGKTPASYWKRWLQVDQSSNTGVDSTTRNIQDGSGINTSISLSDDQFLVKPINDNTTTTLDIKATDNDSILTVNTTDKTVLCGDSQSNALTQYQYFRAQYITPVAGYHIILPLGSGDFSGSGIVEENLGNGLEPAITLDASASSDTMQLVNTYWFLLDDITIDAVNVLMGGVAASGDALNFHLLSYAMDKTTNFGDLSGGVVIADGATTSDVSEDVIKSQNLTRDSLYIDVASGRVIIATLESDSTDQVSINMTIKYHIQ